ncbi:helix-turn-helix domain-containing protein [Iocasia frigidifontis]|uniref:Helix-turn-helix domain-containing protein n=1 Tax=Iocasia fonsfrigidae TaxID=2682810 RepID=A0A8A7KHV9_9FIRM|nr:helix-turn-helix transcriptional regulator [Iocasia fonsfrigidae]QTL99139.1 helix-turn-helix domain-containing protein [Iocasia fonsfrigidae]
MKLGEKLKKLRIENKMTQEDLAKKIGVSRGTVAGYETQDKNPKYKTLKKIASVLNCSIDYLLNNPSTLVEENKNSNFDLQKYITKINERRDLQLLLQEVDKLNSNSVYRIIELLKIIDDEVKNRN